MPPVSIETYRAAAVQLREQSRGEPGCLSYEVWQSDSEPGTFCVMERWESDEAFSRHVQGPAVARIQEVSASIGATGEHTVFRAL